jgi:hypothetical protein
MNKLFKLSSIQIVVILVWTFINTIFLIRDERYLQVDSYSFWPFSDETFGSHYDFLEYFVYVVGAWLVMVIYNFIKTKPAS